MQQHRRARSFACLSLFQQLEHRILHCTYVARIIRSTTGGWTTSDEREEALNGVMDQLQARYLCVFRKHQSNHRKTFLVKGKSTSGCQKLRHSPLPMSLPPPPVLPEKWPRPAATAAHFDQFSPHDRLRGHCPMFGYNTGKVFRDARFRLGLYLREAGLSNTPAAHRAVMRAAGPLPEAPF